MRLALFLPSPPLLRRGRHPLCARQATTASAAPDPALVIVESPAKAATIQKILPESRYRVRSCVGHVRELPGSAKRIPAKYKREPWAKLGVDVADDFRPLYVLIAGKQTIISHLKADLKNSAELILATDEDREGEAISWHLTELLKPTVPVRRAVFHEITPDAIEFAFRNCRDIDLNLVHAQETRRVLDRLAGYTMSPLLWKKIAKGLSAGRVQSVAMSAIVRRELARLAFVPARYAGCTARFEGPDRPVVATLSTVDAVRMVRGSDFDDHTGALTARATAKNIPVFDRPALESLVAALELADARVAAVDKKRTTRSPPRPLITSTLQQECGNKLGFGAGRTMRVAQKLYENGHITYMRTDNPNLSDQAVAACRTCVEALYGKKAVWDGKGPPRVPKPKAAQAAHEAIRPAGSTFTLPEDLPPGLERDEIAVYSLIFKRTLASQMVGAKLDQTTIKIQVQAKGDAPCRKVEFKATGSVVVDPGFLRAYQSEDVVQTPGAFLPSVVEGDKLVGSNVAVLEHETKPPARYNDASLVKDLEELGVGRPSTYASIIEKLIARGYVFRGRMLGENKSVPPRALLPSLTAFAVEKLLSKHFSSFVDAEFTAKMEEALDEIAGGSAERTHYLRQYYCGEDGLAASVERTEKEIDASVFRQILLPNMPPEMLASAAKAGKKVDKAKTAKARASSSSSSGSDGESETDWSNTKVLVSSYGPYVEQNGVVVASLPKLTLADDLTADRLETVLQLAQDPELGTDPKSGMPVLLKTSRYGPYVQLGRENDYAGGTKPKRSSLFPGMDVGTLTIDLALKLLSLPRLLGTHPKSGNEVRAAMGPYGPYVVHDGTYVSLKKDVHNVLEISFDEAMELISASEYRKEVRREKQALKKAEVQAKKKEKGTSSPKVKRSAKGGASAKRKTTAKQKSVA
ncbi:DNA topoisomerase I Mitochondrial [Chondrus crispus]|uniref:DNA topoisomerase n=1 Tax=Chondrus crispus TaxID=2769 RepID=R7Q9A8_CHOCR|nr:DNA topoisomerase I Mitochondrial [Chondrus crispus]CDF35117.1 DNA topoisomerase I Mitochondrial [Chondrus crispus]|eukprot:XP_005714936.1 DNA topoisomerase I Mitochondrial [Chondrus crispus]